RSVSGTFTARAPAFEAAPHPASASLGAPSPRRRGEGKTQGLAAYPSLHQARGNGSGAASVLLPASGEGDCLCSQAFCHGLPSRMIALRMVRSFRIVATMARIFGFPAATSLSRKALRTGL